jgi:hypothetical protein
MRFMGLSRAKAEEIRGKYAEMLAMRVEHADGSEDPARVGPRMSDLAARFPGALREIDDLELAEIRRRIAGLDSLLEASGEEEPWMAPVALFHDLARGALALKRRLAGRRDVDQALVDRFTAEAQSLPCPEEMQGWLTDLATIASPPRGRVMDVVFARLARELGIEEAVARNLVFGRALPR